MMEPGNEFDFLNWIELPQIYVPMAAREQPEKPPRFNTTWRVTTNAELWKAVEHIFGLIKESGIDYPDTLWFRGHTNENFVLLPSIIRSYFRKGLACSLPQYQRTLMEKFLAKSSGTPEIAGTGQYKQANGQIEHIADMQHYGVPTNLLDWSEDIGIPLYFSTEQDFSHAGAIYVLHPYFYNFVRNEMIKQFPRPRDTSLGNTGICSAGQRNLDTTDTCIGGLLPNFSAYFNMSAERYSDFVSGPEYWGGLTDRTQWRNHDPLTALGLANHPAPLLPLAIQVPRNNIRITRQSGAFLAFNLCEFPQAAKTESAEPGDNFHGLQHIALDEIQKFYMLSEELHQRIALKEDTPFYRAMKGRYPFLFKIVIAPGIKPTLNKVAAAMGKRKPTVYPELYRMGEEIEAEAASL